MEIQKVDSCILFKMYNQRLWFSNTYVKPPHPIPRPSWAYQSYEKKL